MWWSSTLLVFRGDAMHVRDWCCPACAGSAAPCAACESLGACLAKHCRAMFLQHSYCFAASAGRAKARAIQHAAALFCASCTRILLACLPEGACIWCTLVKVRAHVPCLPPDAVMHAGAMSLCNATQDASLAATMPHLISQLELCSAVCNARSVGSGQQLPCVSLTEGGASPSLRYALAFISFVAQLI
jgi:hypothetical protein